MALNLGFVLAPFFVETLQGGVQARISCPGITAMEQSPCLWGKKQPPGHAQYENL
jgi:hypothetical protein